MRFEDRGPESSENCCVNAPNTLVEEKLKGKFEAGHNEKTVEDVQDALEWESFCSTEKDEFVMRRRVPTI